jgi:hypothetical protein
LAPVDVPAKSPSSRASRSAIAIASSVETVSISSAIPSCQSGTTKPAPMPSILCAPVEPPVSTADSEGSTPTMRMPEARALRPSAVPRSEAAVPTLWTKPSTRPPVCVQISSASA